MHSCTIMVQLKLHSLPIYPPIPTLLSYPNCPLTTPNMQPPLLAAARPACAPLCQPPSSFLLPPPFLLLLCSSFPPPVVSSFFLPPVVSSLPPPPVAPPAPPHSSAPLCGAQNGNRNAILLHHTEGRKQAAACAQQLRCTGGGWGERAQAAAHLPEPADSAGGLPGSLPWTSVGWWGGCGAPAAPFFHEGHSESERGGRG